MFWSLQVFFRRSGWKIDMSLAIIIVWMLSNVYTTSQIFHWPLYFWSLEKCLKPFVSFPTYRWSLPIDFFLSSDLVQPEFSEFRSCFFIVFGGLLKPVEAVYLQSLSATQCLLESNKSVTSAFLQKPDITFFTSG